jgi:hypothetical protein
VICVVTAQSFGCIRACVHPSTSLRQNAGGRDGDHFHEGVGFLAQHLKLSRRLEQSLQSLHPSLGGLPYWDTSVEMEKLRHKELERVTDAVLWSAEFFGKSGKWHHKRAEDFKVGGGRVHPASPQARLPSCLLHLYLRLLSSLPSIVSYVIPRVLRSLSLSLSLSLSSFSFLSVLSQNDEAFQKASILGGRWRHARVPRVGDGSPWGTHAAERLALGLHVPRNGYGYLRSPWNANPSPYVKGWKQSSGRLTSLRGEWGNMQVGLLGVYRVAAWSGGWVVFASGVSLCARPGCSQEPN